MNPQDWFEKENNRKLKLMELFEDLAKANYKNPQLDQNLLTYEGSALVLKVFEDNLKIQLDDGKRVSLKINSEISQFIQPNDRLFLIACRIKPLWHMLQLEAVASPTPKEFHNMKPFTFEKFVPPRNQTAH